MPPERCTKLCTYVLSTPVLKEFRANYYSLGFAPVNLHILNSEVAAVHNAVVRLYDQSSNDVVPSQDPRKIFAWRGDKSIDIMTLQDILEEAGVEWVHFSHVGLKTKVGSGEGAIDHVRCVRQCSDSHMDLSHNRRWPGFGVPLVSAFNVDALHDVETGKEVFPTIFPLYMSDDILHSTGSVGMYVDEEGGAGGG